MKTRLGMITLAVALSLATALPSQASSGFVGVQYQERHYQAEHPDYSKNSYYQQGNREGYKDYKDNKQRKHNHKFKNDDDRHAYDYGYEQGHQGHYEHPR